MDALFAGLMMAHLSHLVLRSEPATLTLAFETKHQVPALFTPIGDHVVMTVKEWTTKERYRNGTCIYLNDLPQKYSVKDKLVIPLFVQNLNQPTLGAIQVMNRTATICPLSMTLYNINQIDTFSSIGQVGFYEFTVTYAIK